MNLALTVFTMVCIGTGALFFLAGTVGLLRFPDALSRLHALTKADNLGIGLIVIGLLPHADSVLDGVKMACIWLLLLLAAASGSQLIAKHVHDESGNEP